MSNCIAPAACASDKVCVYGCNRGDAYARALYIRVHGKEPPPVEPPPPSTSIFTPAEQRYLDRDAFAMQLVIDYHESQMVEADAVGAIECVEYSQSRINQLKVMRDRLKTARNDKPGDIMLVDAYDRFIPPPPTPPTQRMEEEYRMEMRAYKGTVRAFVLGRLNERGILSREALADALTDDIVNHLPAKPKAP